MKMHITKEQLLEFIKPENKWDKETIDKCFKVLELPIHRILSPELFTIWRMIKILNKELIYIDFPIKDVREKCVVGIGLAETRYENIDIEVKRIFFDDEVIDVLWKATKYILEERLYGL